MANHTGDRESPGEAHLDGAQGSQKLETTAPPLDLFDAIARRLLTQTALITAPGAVDPRWAAIIAQAYREGIGEYAQRVGGALMFRVDPDGLMSILALDLGSAQVEGTAAQ